MREIEYVTHHLRSGDIYMVKFDKNFAILLFFMLFCHIINR